MGIFSQAAAQAPGVRKYIDPVTGEEMDEIVTEGTRRPQQEAIEPIGAPVVAQPAWQQLAGGDPTPVNPNEPELLDRRQMIWQAQEAQRQASAQAMGQEYEPQQQKGKDFKANPGLQFGTTGVARDVIGNAVDFFGSLIGRKPSYRDEKFRDAIYGWDQPGGFEAAINRGMQYDPALTREFLKDVTGAKAVQANSEANREYKTASAQQRNLQGLTGLSTAIISAGDLDAQARAYAQALPALQAQADLAYGKGVYTLPETYDANIVTGLTRSGYTGSNVQREAATILNDETKKFLTMAGFDVKRDIAKLNADARVRAAEIAADASMSNAEKVTAMRKLTAETTPVLVGQTQDILGENQTRRYLPREVINQGIPGTYQGRKGYSHQGRFYSTD